ncbi:endonuclease/exonuclease/phosphatase family protein [Belliella aquatica]|uniref:Endonuclease n=1 Tax=Belliella aquatica TaxID=1323734 RepID=A0ABQ1LRI3_9BACT|nr:endonuclease/exonuclease/phosphatase family protein [Belliella aquatica]MCH7404307.1 endonuclease/exonuclease/phosphatase family protein [Belliella aquatica]GGC26979.1 endonuclease [Belliella aquatica]
MKIFTLILCAVVLITTGLPLIDSAEWWIRIFDFPRIQIAVSTLLAFVLASIYVDFKWKFKLPFLIILLVSLIYQIQFVVVYTPLYKVQAKDSNKPQGENSLKLLVVNVRMENEDKESFHNLVQKIKPDILLINEPDQVWATSIAKLDDDFPYAIKYPLENTYGMILLSKFPLTESKVNFLVKEDIPSIFTKITLQSGVKIDFYGVHPEPPKPGTATYERDTELLLIGKKIKDSEYPTLVAGDLNDVGWSATSKLFRKYSELVDPREGRGLFNTYSVFIPLMRYPLDHIFYSKEFGLISLQKLGKIGSDHYPIMITINYEPDKDNTDGLEKADEEEKQEVEEKINNGGKDDLNN